jgi:hypothetical protein
VAKSGESVPKLIWFQFAESAEGGRLGIYSTPGAAKVSRIRRHAQVSLNLDSEGNGSGIIVVGGRHQGEHRQGVDHTV